MKFGLTLGGLMLGGTAAFLGHTLSQPAAIAVPGGGERGGGVAAGADVIVGAIPDYQKYGTVNGISAYAFGSTSCNIGTVQLDWFANTNQHPVIPQNLYRLKDGRFEQIGMSWCKHGFCALQQTLCGACQPAGGGCPSLLGIGCSDPYNAGLNGNQSDLGPRSQINAATGFFPYPFSAPPAAPTVGRRLQVKIDDLNPALNSGAQYWAEAQYVHPDDAAAANDNNNASFRKVNVGSLSGGAYNLSLTGPTNQQKPAIFAWQGVDPQVTILAVDVPNDGRFTVAYRVTDNGDGTWHYEYAIHNLNSDRSGGSFMVPVAPGVNLTNVGFHDVPYHSGDPYDGTDWVGAVNDKFEMVWGTELYEANPNANALRWSTMYNYRFDANTPPVAGEATLGLFKPGQEGDPDSVTIATLVPSVPTTPCTGDFDFSGAVDETDLAVLLGAWGGPNLSYDLDGDDLVGASDLAIMLGAWGACP